MTSDPTKDHNGYGQVKISCGVCHEVLYEGICRFRLLVLSCCAEGCHGIVSGDSNGLHSDYPIGNVIIELFEE